MLVGDLIHFRAALSNGVSHDMILCPSAATTPAASRRNSTANNSIASQEDKKHNKTKKRHWWSRSSSGTPAVKAANCGAGMKLPMNVV